MTFRWTAPKSFRIGRQSSLNRGLLSIFVRILRQRRWTISRLHGQAQIAFSQCWFGMFRDERTPLPIRDVQAKVVDEGLELMDEEK
jgi:hypothetical protein